MNYSIPRPFPCSKVPKLLKNLISQSKNIHPTEKKLNKLVTLDNAALFINFIRLH